MKARERFCEALRRIIAVFQREVNHLNIPGEQFMRRQREPTRADILAHAHTRQRCKRPLQIKPREPDVPRCLAAVRLVQQMRFDVLQREIEALHQFHALLLCPPAFALAFACFPYAGYDIKPERIVPVFSCQDLSGIPLV